MTKSKALYRSDATFCDCPIWVEAESVASADLAIRIMEDYFEPYIKTRKPAKKPPLGVMPQSTHRSNRRRDIIEGMSRYAKENKRIPAEWIEELGQLNE